MYCYCLQPEYDEDGACKICYGYNPALGEDYQEEYEEWEEEEEAFEDLEDE